MAQMIPPDYGTEDALSERCDLPVARVKGLSGALAVRAVRAHDGP